MVFYGREGARAREQESKQDMVRERAVRVTYTIMCGCIFWHVLAWRRMCIWPLAPVSLPDTSIESTEKLGDLQHTVRVTAVVGRLQLQWWDFLLPRNGYSRDKKLEGKQTCVHTTQRYIFTYVLLH